MVKGKGTRKQKNKKNFNNFVKGAKSGSSTNPDRKAPSTAGNPRQDFYRSKGTIKRLNMYNQKPDLKKMNQRPEGSARVQPDRKWFGNVRTIDQKAIEKYRVELAQAESQPRSVLVRAKKLPLNLLQDPTERTFKLLEVETYEQTFGPNARRKKVKLASNSLQDLAQEVNDQWEDKRPEEQDWRQQGRDIKMKAGQSKRIWEQLYKVLDSSDVVCQVLDARDPPGTRSKALEGYLSKHAPQKHLVFILNKVDLVPMWVTAKWVSALNKERPTVAFRASITNPFGKGSLINLLRQFDQFHRDKKELSVGFVGYPNVGKSSVINTLKEKACCKAAPIPGETRVWQYVTLTARINLIDCPGTVHMLEGTSDINQVLRGCVRAERIQDPEYYIPELLEKANARQLKALYKIEQWSDPDDFLQRVGRARGKLVKGGEVDMVATAKIVLMDWCRGRIMFYHLPEGVPPNEQFYEEEANQMQSQQINHEAFQGTVGLLQEARLQAAQ